MNKSLADGDLSSRATWRNVRSPLQRTTTQFPTLTDKNGNACHTVQQKLYALADQFLNPPQPENVTEEEKRNYQVVENETLERLTGRVE